MAEDRNLRARNEFADAQRAKEMRHAREQFAKAVQAGQAALFDAVGCRLAPGQLVMFAPPPNVWRWLIADVLPVMDVSVPPGMMRIMLKLDVPLNLPAGQSIGNMLVVGEQEQVAPPALAVEAPVPAEPPYPQDADMMPVEPPPTSPDATGHSDD